MRRSVMATLARRATLRVRLRLRVLTQLNMVGAPSTVPLTQLCHCIAVALAEVCTRSRHRIPKQLLRALARQQRLRRGAKMENVIEKCGGKTAQQVEQAPKARHQMARTMDN